MDPAGFAGIVLHLCRCDTTKVTLLDAIPERQTSLAACSSKREIQMLPVGMQDTAQTGSDIYSPVAPTSPRFSGVQHFAWQRTATSSCRDSNKSSGIVPFGCQSFSMKLAARRHYDITIPHSFWKYIKNICSESPTACDIDKCSSLAIPMQRATFFIWISPWCYINCIIYYY